MPELWKHPSWVFRSYMGPKMILCSSRQQAKFGQEAKLLENKHTCLVEKGFFTLNSPGFVGDIDHVIIFSVGEVDHVNIFSFVFFMGETDHVSIYSFFSQVQVI